MLLVALLTSVLLARLLGPEGKGALTLLLVYTGFIVSVAEIGIRQATVFQLGRQHHGEKAVVETVLFMLIATSSLGVLAAWLIYALLDNAHLDRWMIALACALIPVQLTAKYVAGILLGKQQIARFNRISWIPLVANALLLIVFVWLLDWGVSGALASLLIAHGSVSLYSLYIVAQGVGLRPALHRKVAVEMLRLGVVYAAGFFILILNYRVGVAVLERLVPIGDVGRYALAVSIAELIWQLPAVVGAVIFVRSAAASERREFTEKVVRLFRVSLAAGALAAAVMAAVGPPLVTLVFGEAFAASGTILVLLLPGVVVMIAQKVLNMDLGGQGKPHAGLPVFVCSALLNAALCFLWVPRYGVYAAAVASSVSYFFAAAGFLIVYMRHTGTTLRDILIYRRSDFAFLKPMLSQAWRR